MEHSLSSKPILHIEDGKPLVMVASMPPSCTRSPRPMFCVYFLTCPYSGFYSSLRVCQVFIKCLSSVYHVSICVSMQVYILAHSLRHVVYLLILDKCPSLYLHRHVSTAKVPDGCRNGFWCLQSFSQQVRSLFSFPSYARMLTHHDCLAGFESFPVWLPFWRMTEWIHPLCPSPISVILPSGKVFRRKSVLVPILARKLVCRVCPAFLFSPLLGFFRECSGDHSMVDT